MAQPTDETVIAGVEGRVGVITLNRPKALNALDDDMVVAMRAALDDWATDDTVRAVWVQGAGERGLCAGGDIRAVRDAVISDDLDLAMHFFTQEYRLNATIADYPKPYVVWMDGVVMGGGIGISAHGSHRLATERTRLAMPETIIGFFPDVGAMWLLARAPGELGAHMALTGTTVGGADAVLLGLADHVAPSASKDQMYADLARSADRLSNEQLRLWTPQEPAAPDPGSALEPHREWIDECFAGVDAAVIVERLRAHADPRAAEAASLIEQRSPHSVALTLEGLRRAETMSLQEVFAQDVLLARACASHPDFVEGVRAQVVDKDRQPQWADRHISEVDRADVLAAFD